MSDRGLNNVMAQYFPGQSISSEFRSSQKLPGEAPAAFSQGDVENLVASLASQGMLDGFDFGSTVFNFLLPPGTVLNTDSEPSSEAEPAFDPSIALRSVRHHRPKKHPNPVHREDEDSTNGLGGYHGSVQLEGPDGNSAKVYYAVGVYSEIRPDGSANGIPVFDQPWKNVVATFYHELNEARTDADVEDAIKAGDTPEAASLLGWVSQQGEECGDFPVFEANPLTEVFQEVPLADGSGTVPVQFQYSNAVHGPEGPIDQPHSAGDPGSQPQPHQPHHPHHRKHH